MKGSISILAIGVVVFCLSFITHSIYGVSNGEFLSPLVWHMLWIGALLSGIGIALIFLNQKIKTENNMED